MPELHRDACLAVGIGIADGFEAEKVAEVGMAGLAEGGIRGAYRLAVAALLEFAGLA
jgi:hypothetical protein